MIQTSNIKLEDISIHKVGNKLDDEGIRFSKKGVTLSHEIKTLLIQYFFSPFKENEMYNFFHDYDLSMNEIYTYAKDFFNQKRSLHEQSVSIAKQDIGLLKIL